MTEALGDEGVSSSAATPTCRRGAESNSGLNGLLVGGCFFIAQKEMWELCLVDGGKDVVVEIAAEEEHLAALLVHVWSSDVGLASLPARLFRYDQAGAIGNIETR